jgi:hypothetical protein
MTRLRSSVDAARAFARRAKVAALRRVEWARWRIAVTRGALFGVRLERLVGDDDPAAVPVIMCLWNRVDRIEEILRLLSVQRDCPPIRLVLWNNYRPDDATYRSRIVSTGARGSLVAVEYHCSRVNLGGIARFVLARRLFRGKPSGPFIMLDDDQDVAPTFVRDLLAVYEPRTYAGCWAFVNEGQYWERREANPEEDATYVGTGGSICDSALVRETAFFQRLPVRYGFVEDLWASRVARSRGWRLKKVDTPVTFVLHSHNQFAGLAEVKTRFWSYLERRHS